MNLLVQIWLWLKEQVPAIAVSIFSYMQSQVSKMRLENEKLDTELKIKEADEALDKDLSLKSPTDLVNDAIRKGRGP